MSESECKWHQEQIGTWVRDDGVEVNRAGFWGNWYIRGNPDQARAPQGPFSTPTGAMDYADRFIPDRRNIRTEIPAEWTPPPKEPKRMRCWNRHCECEKGACSVPGFYDDRETAARILYPDDNPTPEANILIGLTGPAGSGKDTVADELERLGYDRYALASPLKTGLRAMFDLTREHTDGKLKEISIPELGGLTPRRLMQTLGTEWARNTVHDDVWLWLARQQWEGAGYPGLVITDVRFDNEADFIRAHGGTVWHVQRPEEHRPVFSESHASEAGVTDRKGDVTVDNSGTLDDLKRAVAKAVQQTREGDK